MTPRPSTPDEALDLWHAARAAEGRRPSAVQRAEERERLADGPVVVVDGAGFAHGTVEGEVLHLRAVVVLPAARRQGHGAALADALADAAYALGARSVRAEEGPEGFLAALGLEPGDGGWTGVLEPPLRALEVSTDGLRLGQLLKLAGLVDTGAEAKALLATGEVLLNGEPEVRRGRQVVEGDVVTARGQAVQVVPPPG